MSQTRLQNAGGTTESQTRITTEEHILSTMTPSLLLSSVFIIDIFHTEFKYHCLLLYHLEYYYLMNTHITNEVEKSRLFWNQHL